MSIKLILVMEQKEMKINSPYSQHRMAAIYLWFYMTHFPYFMGQFATYLHINLCHVMNFHCSQTKLQATKSLVDIAKRRRNTDLTKKDGRKTHATLIRLPKKHVPSKIVRYFYIIIFSLYSTFVQCLFLSIFWINRPACYHESDWPAQLLDVSFRMSQAWTLPSRGDVTE